MAENYVPANKLNQRDVYADTWVAADNLNRKVENYDGTNPPRDKKVGMFYLTWHMPEHAPYYDKANMYDTYQAYKDGGVDGVYKQLQEGPLGFGHYWARPYLGYYQSTDDWVIRKHAQQLSNAGIDFLYLDASNGVSYIGAYDKIFKIFKEIREEGGKTPQIVFFTAVDPTNSAKVVNEVYEEYYKPGQYTDLWFMWEGKPVIFSCNDDFVGISDEIKNFFTFRRCWAFDEQWFTKVNGVNSWPWIMDYPQKPGITADGKVEQVVASCGFHATGLPIAHGRSYAGGEQPGTDKEDFGFSLMESTTPLGLAFDEQWSRVVELDPPIAMITGWNEWWAGRWDNTLEGGGNPAEGQVQCNTYVITASDEVKQNYFVDCFNPEYSRDFEAMTGGFGDNYYWQLVKNVREWRGARPLPGVQRPLHHRH